MSCLRINKNEQTTSANYSGDAAPRTVEYGMCGIPNGATPEERQAAVFALIFGV